MGNVQTRNHRNRSSSDFKKFKDNTKPLEENNNRLLLGKDSSAEPEENNALDDFEEVSKQPVKNQSATSEFVKDKKDDASADKQPAKSQSAPSQLFKDKKNKASKEGVSPVDDLPSEPVQLETDEVPDSNSFAKSSPQY